MGQYHAIFNLDKKVGIDPHSLGDGVKLMEFGMSLATMSSLVYLLADGWCGERIAIVGDYVESGDLPNSEEVCGVPDVELYDALRTTKDKRIKPVGWLARKILEDEGTFAFDTYKSSIRNLNGTTTSFNHHRATYLNPEAPEGDVDDVVVFNYDKLELMDPKAFGGSGTLHDTANNGYKGGITTALAVILAATAREGGRGGGDIREDNGRVGHWAGDRIGVISREEVESIAEVEDVSVSVRDLLVQAHEASFDISTDGTVTCTTEW